jgi:hypothetical protein
MVTSRHIEDADRAGIEAALAHDTFHPDTKADAFYLPNVLTSVYEDEAGPIMLVRGARSLRIDMLFFSNTDSKRNREAMLAGWETLASGAKNAGFLEITTSSNSPALVAFACKVLGFEQVQTEQSGEIALRRQL